MPLLVIIPRLFAIAAFGGAPQQRHRLLIISIWPHASIKPRDRFRVVIQHVGLRIEHGVERVFVAVEIGNQNFDLALGIQRAHLANRFGPMRRAAVRQIVAID